MNMKEQLQEAIDHLSDSQVKVLWMIVNTWNDDKYDEQGNVIIDSFYQELLKGIAEDDEGTVYSKEELEKELGLWK